MSFPERLDAFSATELSAESLRWHFPPRAEDTFSLVDEGDLRDALLLADVLLTRSASSAELGRIEGELADTSVPASVGMLLAVKLARSRKLLLERSDPVFVSVVFAVYRETERILRPDQHVFGEDFVNRKVAQLEWLLAGVPDAEFELVVVDDGCPDRSGAVVERVVAEGGLEERVRVLFLADAIERGHPAVDGLRSVDESRKGGSIQLGMWEAAAADRGPGHVVIFTDADLSTHLGQTGLLIEAVRRGGPVAIGSRRHPRSVVRKRGARNERGKLFIYLWKALLEPLGGIVDTQCGFKAFDARVVHPLVRGMQERRFAFDIELLLRTVLDFPEAAAPISPVGVGWIDSEALSTTTNLQPYHAMLQSVAGMYRRYLDPTPEAEEFATFIEELGPEQWAVLETLVPPEIAGRDPRLFDEWRGVTAQDLSAALG